MNPRVLLGIAVVVLLGVGGVIGFMEYQRHNKPKPPPILTPPPVEAPPPLDPEEAAKLEGAKEYASLNEQLAKEPDNPELYLKRAQAIFKAKEAITLDPKQRALIAIEDVLHSQKMKLETADLFEALVLAVKWIEALNFERHVKEEWIARGLASLDAGVQGGKPAHKARLEFIKWRFTRSFAPEERPWRERELESLDALLQTKEATAAWAERAGDLAKEFQKLNKATTYYKQAAALDPDKKEYYEAKMPK